MRAVACDNGRAVRLLAAMTSAGAVIGQREGRQDQRDHPGQAAARPLGNRTLHRRAQGSGLHCHGGQGQPADAVRALDAEPRPYAEVAHVMDEGPRSRPRRGADHPGLPAPRTCPPAAQGFLIERCKPTSGTSPPPRRQPPLRDRRARDHARQRRACRAGRLAINVRSHGGTGCLRFTSGGAAYPVTRCRGAPAVRQARCGGRFPSGRSADILPLW